LNVHAPVSIFLNNPDLSDPILVFPLHFVLQDWIITSGSVLLTLWLSQFFPGH